MLAAAVAAVSVLVGAILTGWDARAWLAAVWHSLGSVSPVYLLPALALQALRSAFSAVGWYGILRYAYPRARLSYLEVLACYATGVALNNVLPANAGTVVTVLMFVATIAPATLVGVLAAAAVEKLFFAVAGVLVAVYLFVSVGGTFERKFGFLSGHGWTSALAVAGVVLVVALAARLAWRRLKRLWEQARQGGRILSRPRVYLEHVALPQLLSWGCGLGTVAVLLAAYGIPVSFHTLMSVLGGNSVANIASLTPGGIGVTQAFNVASLHAVASSANASAYSVGQQLLMTAWNIVLALVLVAVAFGRSGGRRLVEQACAQARKQPGEALSGGVGTEPRA
jgi:uncharacterized membrane protein YbhN (UPF0104 family)